MEHKQKQINIQVQIIWVGQSTTFSHTIKKKGGRRSSKHREVSWLTRGVCTHNKQMHKHICKKHKRWSPGSSKHTELSWATRGVRKHTHKHISKKHTMRGLGSNKHTELRNTRQFDCTFSQTHEHKMKRNVTHSQTTKVWSWVNKALINPGC